MLKVNNKNTRKKYEIFPGGNYSKKNVWGKFDGGKFQRGSYCPDGGKFQRGSYCPEGNYLGVIVRG